ncbi:putative Methionyl-tRNA formyltransferase [Melia azedarach]|uniref:Methionyl-tRNA formyltransferase n=1 Tax=Melia azedarach TaxID=155640 RepID=A0ACC1X7M3_MELAZ|nr:putative Methionyl-tRNA formyltransferase [Melia azedarach]
MNSSLMLRRFFCFNSATAAGAATSSSTTSASAASKKKPLVFLGSPQVSATVLDGLFSASSAPNSSFEVAAIVTQPPARRDRGRKVLPSPVALHALDRGFPSELIFTPERAGEDSFLSSLRALQPELCITAAYGNILPTKFLNIPTLGTVNIHPSLLPLYRGAAPVQRALQDGVTETGVSLAFTVRALDAGPVIASEKMEVDDHIKAPDLLVMLFSEGSKLLIRELPSILDGSARVKAKPQDDSKATLAPKITPEESWLSFAQEAIVLHNKVRAFAGWPGTRAKMAVIDDNGHESTIELKIITTRVCSNVPANEVNSITFRKGAVVVPCGGSTALEVLEVQLPGKKVVGAAAFWNGLRGQKLKMLQ